jgi:hypothetical protein
MTRREHSRDKTTRTTRAHHKRTPPQRWSQRVTEESDALDLEPAVFTKRDPREIAESLLRSAEQSKRRKTSPFRSAMSMLTFYINRAGENLPAARRKVLEKAKDELRALHAAEERGESPPTPG